MTLFRKNLLIYSLLLIPSLVFTQDLVLEKITILVAGRDLSNAEKTAARMLSEEVQKRTGMQWRIVTAWPADGDVIVLKKAAGKIKIPVVFSGLPVLPQKPESFRIATAKKGERTVMLIEGIDGRGVLFAVGRLLRSFRYNKGNAVLHETLPLADSPDKPIRGHQLGYRNTANSYDGWTVSQFEQYIRELVVFGSNSIESIPIFDEKTSPHFKIPSLDMTARLSEICQRYDLDYWMWIPAQFDLKDKDKRKNYLDTFEKICKSSVRINGVFFPGGDPGDNPPELVLPLLQDLATLVKKYHPKAMAWLSLQGFNTAQSRTVYEYIQQKMPVWLGGLVTGPGSPPVEETRAALPAKYLLRYYPDLTHTVRCDFPVSWWDPAFNFTLGRECVNPQPYYYSAVYHALAQYTDGFISYSDGIHDDVNKIVWTALAWNPQANERDIVKEYSNFFFGSAAAEDAADGILSLEKNWEGPIVSNGNIQSALQAWKNLESNYPELSENWRWQMCLLRAYYDAYTRKRFIYENKLEQQANAALLTAGTTGAGRAMADAEAILAKAETEPVEPQWHEKIIGLCEALYQSISLQTSVKKYQASGEERGAVLDFLDRPVNNRWWMEDEFKRISRLPEQEQVKALDTIARWENPGPGSFYDDVGNISQSPHVWRGEGWVTDPLMRKGDNPGFDWWESGFSRKRLSWMSNMRWPATMEYTGLDSTARYTVRITGYGESLLKANGQRLEHTLYGKGIGEIKEFPVPQSLTQHGKLLLTWDDIDEEHLNWRQHSRVTEVWLIKNK